MTKAILSVVAIVLVLMAGCDRMTPLTHDPVFDAQYIKTRSDLATEMMNMRRNGGIYNSNVSPDLRVLIDDMNSGAAYWDDEQDKVQGILDCRIVGLNESGFYARRETGAEPNDIQACIDNGRVK